MTRVSRILPYLIVLAIYINTQILCRRDLTSRNLQIYFVSMGFISNKTFYILRSLVRNKLIVLCLMKDTCMYLFLLYLVVWQIND